MSRNFLIGERWSHLAWVAVVWLGVTSPVSSREKQSSPPPDAEMEMEDAMPVPDSGPLNVEQLILLAHYNNPKIQRLRAEAAAARWRKESARDWRDPEIRWGWGEDIDVQVDQPYTESSVSRANFLGSEQQSEFTSGNGEIRDDRTRLSTRENRYRVIERRVIPGATQDIEEERIYEVRRQSEKGYRTRNETDKAERRDFTGSKTTRREVGYERTVTRHQDVTEPDYSFGVGLRLFLPNPFEIRARVAQAEGEIALADAELAAEEDEMAREVRALYEDLAFLEAEKGALRSLAAHSAEMLQSMENLWTVYGADKLADAREESSKVEGDILSGEFAVRRVAVKLASLVGLGDPSRIQVSPNLKRRMVDVNSLDRAYLLEMAGIYRADLAEAIARNRIATGQYLEQKATRIPWAGFVEVGWRRSWDRGDRSADQFGISGGVTVPIFSWFKNKGVRAAEAEMRMTSKVIGSVHRRLEADIDLALNELRAAQAGLQASGQHQGKVKRYATQNQALADQAGPKGDEIKSTVKKMVIRANMQNLEAAARYNAAVQLLEDALGTSLGNVLKSGN